MSLFTVENALHAIEQFKTKEELAGLFLELTEQLFGNTKEIIDLNKELTTLKEQNKKLRESVEWYADRKNCDNPDFSHIAEIDRFGEEIADGGFLARKCLEEIGGME